MAKAQAAPAAPRVKWATVVETDDGRFDVYLLETYGVPDKAKRVGSERDPLYADERFDVLVNTEIKKGDWA